MQDQDYYSDQGLVCPSFNTYTESTADIAARVCREFRSLGFLDEDKEFEDYEEGEDQQHGQGQEEEEEEEDDDFEFVSFQKSADEVFFGDNSRIGPVFPVFKRDLDEAAPSSSTSSEADEMEGVPAGSYCVWIPKMTPASSPSHCKKSKSTETSS